MKIYNKWSLLNMQKRGVLLYHKTLFLNLLVTAYRASRGKVFTSRDIPTYKQILNPKPSSFGSWYTLREENIIIVPIFWVKKHISLLTYLFSNYNLNALVFNFHILVKFLCDFNIWIRIDKIPQLIIMTSIILI